MFGIQEVPSGSVLVLLCPVIKISGKRQQPNPGRITNSPESPEGLGHYLPTPNKEPQPAEVLVEGKGNMGWLEEEGIYKYHL